MKRGSITDVAGIQVGHHQRLDPDATLGSGWATGTTVVLAPPGAVGAVDVRGGAPGSRETDLLDPANSVRYVDAIALTGGSAYGLAAADGVMSWLEENGRGLAMDDGLVPIVPAAVIFDLPVGGWACRPTAEFGYRAVSAAGVDVATGTVGAGVGARAGVLKGGVGTASRTLDNGVTVGAIVVVNCAGNVVDPATGLPWMARLIDGFGLQPPRAEEIAAFAELDRADSPLNTTIAVVATDAVLSPAACRRMAIAAHDGLAHSIRPAHTPIDGDTVFALATGAVELPPDVDPPPAGLSPETKLVAKIGAAAADVLADAVLVGVLAADSIAGIPTYRGMLPSAFGGERSERWVLVIRADLVDAMVAHARADHPDEACGVIAGPDGSDRPERFVAMTNAERSPTFYRFDSQEQLRVWRGMDDVDEVPVVIYHSHTATEAYPSRTDISYASEPDAHYVLVSTRDPDAHELRSYRILDGVVTEEPVKIVDEY